MSNYVIITDATADLTPELINQYQLEQIPMEVWVDQDMFHIYPDEHEIKIQDFYDKLREGKRGRTTLINVATFMEFFQPHLEAGNDILYLGVTSTLSGTISQAKTASELLQKKYPNNQIIIVDSFTTSLGLALLTMKASQKKIEGLSIQENADFIKSIRHRMNAIFTVPNLDSLRKGGRVRGATALIANLLGIKPVLHMDKEGNLVSLKNIRGWPKALKEVALQVVERLPKELASEEIVFIGHSDNLLDAQRIGGFIQELVPVKEIKYAYLGPVIGAHGGPATLCVFFLGTHR
ncbi:MAG: DegV family protein [Bacilli bacterium]|jgi:DegV family protein with EDD domain|nr:DegV family protein [Bacilli bacterium]HKM02391.1 DegV family protein [Bacilli bacterium]